MNQSTRSFISGALSVQIDSESLPQQVFSGVSRMFQKKKTHTHTHIFGCENIIAKFGQLSIWVWGSQFVVHIRRIPFPSSRGHKQKGDIFFWEFFHFFGDFFHFLGLDEQ